MHARWAGRRTIRVRREGLRYGFTDDPDEYDYCREALADLNDGNCRY